MAVVNGAADKAPNDILVMPPIPYGFNEHHKDFPGGVWVEPETLISFITDITKSLAHHGFRRILLLNSHGSNHPVLNLAARKAIIQSDVICVSTPYWNSISSRINELRKSEIGGIAHAGEFETAIYLYLHPELVNLDKAEKQILHNPDNKFFNLDLAAGGSPASLMHWWSAISPDGTMGDPTLADSETDRLFLEAAIDATVELVQEIRMLPIRKRKDHH